MTKEEADSFEITDTGHSRIPACQLQAFYDTDGERSPPRLRHVVKILGSSADQFFRISEEFSTVTTQQSGMIICIEFKVGQYFNILSIIIMVYCVFSYHTNHASNPSVRIIHGLIKKLS